MVDLIYSMITSLDGFVADADADVGWAEPDEEQLTAINDLERRVGTYLYGRRMYEMLAVWETDPSLADASPANADYAAIWQAADKVVYSTTLDVPTTARTRIEPAFCLRRRGGAPAEGGGDRRPHDRWTEPGGARAGRRLGRPGRVLRRTGGGRRWHTATARRAPLRPFPGRPAPLHQRCRVAVLPHPVVRHGRPGRRELRRPVHGPASGPRRGRPATTAATSS